MSLLVFECGCDTLETALLAAKRLADDKTWENLSVLFVEDEAEMRYRDIQIDLLGLPELFSRNTISSVSIEFTATAKSFVSIFKPGFCGDTSTLWLVYSEKETHFEKGVLEPLKAIEGMRFVSVSLEESLDWEAVGEISVGSFPWSHWRLICGAVRRDDNSWEQRFGLSAPTRGQ